MKYFCTVSHENEMWVVEFPDLPNVITWGDTKEEALQMASEALNGAVASDVARGILPPLPRFSEGHPVELEPQIVTAIELRTLRGKNTQAEIASRIGISYQAYQRIENPIAGNPTVKTLNKIARAFGKRLEIHLT